MRPDVITTAESDPVSAQSPRAFEVIRGVSIPSGVANNLLSLYGLYFASYLMALVTVPYLSRVLGPATWGIVAAVQSFGACLLTGIEFGFTFSGTREVARAREDRKTLKDVLSAVQGAKLLLALLSCGVALIVEQTLPLFRDHAAAFWWGVVWAIIQGSNLMWFFQGIEKMRLVASLDFGIRLAAVLATFALVRGPADAWRVLALQAAASFVSLVVSFGMARSLAGFRVPERAAVLRALRGGVKTFVPRNASALYTAGNTFLLGFFARPEIVGFYAAADRICRAIVGLLTPASEAIYPRISHMALRAPERALRLTRLSALIMVTVGVVMGAILFLLAPWLVRTLLGPGYSAAVEPLRILCILPPLVAIRNVLGIHWMLPLDLERQLNAVVVTCGAANIVLAVIVAPRYGGVGMAWVVVASHLIASLGAWLVLRWMRLDPFVSYPAKEKMNLVSSAKRVAETVAD
jgi:PST family polysaccharide transporter